MVSVTNTFSTSGIVTYLLFIHVKYTWAGEEDFRTRWKLANWRRGSPACLMAVGFDERLLPVINWKLLGLCSKCHKNFWCLFLVRPCDKKIKHAVYFQTQHHPCPQKDKNTNRIFVPADVPHPEKKSCNTHKLVSPSCSEPWPQTRQPLLHHADVWLLNGPDLVRLWVQGLKYGDDTVARWIAPSPRSEKCKCRLRPRAFLCGVLHIVAQVCV